MKSLTRAEESKLYSYLLQSTDPKDVFLQLLFETGARVSEALGLVGGSLSSGSLDIEPLKGSKPRRVVLSLNLQSKLTLPMSGTLGQALFPAAARASHRRLIVRHYHALSLRLLGARRHVHGLRHTAFSRVYRTTKDLLKTQAWAGHVSIQSTVTYMLAESQAEVSTDNLAALAAVSQRA